MSFLDFLVYSFTNHPYHQLGGAPPDGQCPYNHPICFELFNNKATSSAFILPINNYNNQGLAVLLGLENDGSYVGQYNLIGGKMNPEDNYCYIKNAIREAFEESCINLANLPNDYNGFEKYYTKLNPDLTLFDKHFKDGNGNYRYFIYKHSPIFIGYFPSLSSTKLNTIMQSRKASNFPHSWTEMDSLDWFWAEIVPYTKIRSNGTNQISSFASPVIDKISQYFFKGIKRQYIIPTPAPTPALAPTPAPTVTVQQKEPPKQLFSCQQNKNTSDPFAFCLGWTCPAYLGSTPFSKYNYQCTKATNKSDFTCNRINTSIKPDFLCKKIKLIGVKFDPNNKWTNFKILIQDANKPNHYLNNSLFIYNENEGQFLDKTDINAGGGNATIRPWRADSSVKSEGTSQGGKSLGIPTDGNNNSINNAIAQIITYLLNNRNVDKVFWSSNNGSLGVAIFANDPKVVKNAANITQFLKTELSSIGFELYYYNDTQPTDGIQLTDLRDLRKL